MSIDHPGVIHKPTGLRSVGCKSAVVHVVTPEVRHIEGDGSSVGFHTEHSLSLIHTNTHTLTHTPTHTLNINITFNDKIHTHGHEHNVIIINKYIQMSTLA